LINGGAALGVNSGTGSQNAQSGSGAPLYFAAGSFSGLTASAPTFSGSNNGGVSRPLPKINPNIGVYTFLRVL
jgi:hypothetical protein